MTLAQMTIEAEQILTNRSMAHYAMQTDDIEEELHNTTVSRVGSAMGRGKCRV